MARIKVKKAVELELTDEEREVLKKASKILDKIAEEDGADELYTHFDNYNDSWYYLSAFLDLMVLEDCH